MTRVSVAMATFDGARFVEAQVRSILDQSRAPDEVVVGDDGSRDGTLDLVRRMVDEHGGSAMLRILSPGDRLGVAGNFARVLDAVSGEIVVLADQDDVWRSDRIAVALDALADRAASLVFGDADLIDGEGAVQPETLFGTLPVHQSELQRVDAGDAFGVLLRRNIVTGATVAVRRSLIESALPIPPEWLHDEWLAIWAAAFGGVRRTPERLVGYRLHGANVIGVSAPTLTRRIRRVLEPRGERTRTLALRSAALAARLAAAGADPERVRGAEGKARFEAARAELRPARLLRPPGVIRIAATGDYARFASQGSLDMVRDLLQPAL
ncbi:hypothetical protein GCM10009840_14390 [Pseudolysinimonas kribbensis]|uniref:glycosyltransferase n=1 Tax=Pseudolysinimonas kribbensis TaxID=433641 RepID=UPI0031DAB35F